MGYWCLLLVNLSIKTLCLVSGTLLLMGKQDRGRSYLGLFLTVSFFAELAAFFLAYFKGNNMLVFYTFMPVSFILVSLYIESLNFRFKRLRLSWIMSVVILGSSAFSFYHGYGWKDSNALTSILCSTLIIASSVDSIVVLYSSTEGTKTVSTEILLLYINILYSLGSLPVWIFFEIFSPGNYPKSLSRIVFSSLYLVTNISLLLLALLLLPHKQKKQNL